MTDKQKRFCDEYLVDQNATRAYKEAYPNIKNDTVAGVNGARLLKTAKVGAYIADAMEAKRKRNEVTADKVIAEMAKIAFCDVTSAVRVETKTRMIDGEPVEYQTVYIKNTDELTPEQKAAVKSIKQTRDGIAVEFYPKDSMLSKLGEHLGMFRQDINITGKLETGNPVQGLTTEELKKLIASKGV